MPDPKPRRWLQLHLSTCAVLMFVAGGMIWANVTPSKMNNAEAVCGYGFPWIFYEAFDEQKLAALTRVADERHLSWEPIWPQPPNWKMLGLNVFFFGLVLAIFALVAEWLVQKKHEFHKR